ncbi:hypothetical protein BC829DRAFT_381677 [Chytridium lagenaria]|nr:hypothetical protein BC829DRAFT_381677 [Chytridium lagenaria]
MATINLDGFSTEFSILQSRTCIPNKVVLGVTIFNLSYTAFTFFTVVFAFARDFISVSKAWTETKSVFCLTLGAACSVVLMSISDITGSHVVNSVAWMCATLFLCTVIGPSSPSNLVSITSKELQKQYESLKIRMLILSCVVMCILIPIFSVRIAMFNYNDPLAYNITFMVHCLLMMPWFATFAYTVYSFGNTLATILEDSVKQLSKIAEGAGGPSNGGPSSNGQASTGVSSSNNALESNASNTAAARNEKKRLDTLNIAFKVRLVGYGLIVDKLGFIGSYITICVYGFLTLRNTQGGTLAWMSYYAYNFVVIPWATALIWICLLYNWRSSSTKPAANNSNTATKGNAGGTASDW